MSLSDCSENRTEKTAIRERRPEMALVERTDAIKDYLDFSRIADLFKERRGEYLAKQEAHRPYNR